MKKHLLTGFCALVLLFSGAGQLSAQKSKIKEKYKYQLATHQSEDGKYTYFTVYGDPLRTRMYNLKNGLSVYMTVNKNEPRISTAIAVKAGSKSDPADATGLAHYLEHMLFKGTDKYGTIDYEKEKALLDEIEEKYEIYRLEKDEEKRKALYAEIDSISGEAAKYAIANEYDKMLSAIGAKGTNAFTSFEQTVYINDIPSNQVDKWLEIEGERFRNPVLRLFHTELEAVYEEKNISIDNDRRSAFFQMFEGLFPKHNYGQQTTIGTIEHLKNPSIKKIKEYYKNYYVPNNMAICLSGDFDPDKMIEKIDKHFGYYKKQAVTPYDAPVEEPLQHVVVREVTGPEAESVMMGYRLSGIGERELLVGEMIDMILNNSSAGLIDLNLNKKQKVLRAYSYVQSMRDYSVHVLGGVPKEGQTLEEVQELLLEQLELVKSGEFDEDLLAAIVNDMEMTQMKGFENNFQRMFEFVGAFTAGEDWTDHVQKLDKMRQITRDDVIEVANKLYGENYCVVYKRNGSRDGRKKVVKPEITPVEVNRDAQSPFLKNVVEAPVDNIAPRFVDYDKDIVKKSLNNDVRFHYVKNEENKLFTLYYLLDIGKMHDKELAFAISYLPFLGTDKYDPEAISKKFYQLGSSFNVFTGDDQVYVYLQGLAANFDESVELFEHLLANAKADDAALEALVGRTMKSRSDAKLNKGTILWSGMFNYGKYGDRNPYNDRLSNEQLQNLKASDLVAKIKSLTTNQHRVLYYGPTEADQVVASLNKLHVTPAKLKPTPKVKAYQFQDTDKNKVYFVDYDMVQAEVLWLSKSVDYDPGMATKVRMFNEYYGGNMSSIVFQTIRESKALAYSTFSSFSTPAKKGEPYYVQAYVGTQADKIHDAIDGMNELLTEIPRSDNLFDGSKASIKNKIETERITRTGILFNYETAMKRGLDRDLRKDQYEQIGGLDFEAIQDFHKKYIAGKTYTMLVLGSKDKIDQKELEKYGEVVELKLEDLFGY